MKNIASLFRPLFLWLCILFPLQAEVQVIKNNIVPNRIRSMIVVLSADWVGQIPPSGRVNGPESLTTLYPGQKVALALIAEGPERDKLLNGLNLHLRFSSPTKGVSEQHDLKPAAIRPIKAEGADIAILMLKAGGIAQQDQAYLEKATSLVTFAVFLPEWTAPIVNQAEEVHIAVTISGIPLVTTIEPVSIKVRPAADWLNDPSPSREEIGKYMTRYHEDLSPGRLLSLLKAVASYDDIIKVPPVCCFFVIAYKENLAARNTAIDLFPSLDQKTQNVLLLILQMGGQDVSSLFPMLPVGPVASLKTVDTQEDPRNLPHFKGPVEPESVRKVGIIMDQCWAGWMATGDRSYLRALVGLLEGAEDFPAFQSWTNTRGGVNGLTAQVASGLAYQIAGWSLGSFQRTDPHVADWLLFWENDPAFPALLRNEIASLPNNPAFRRK
ncbi:MAG: hypothetical protein WC378_10215 [Opitutaceae bacterium]|jgi:hypothetical protein